VLKSETISKDATIKYDLATIWPKIKKVKEKQNHLKKIDEEEAIDATV